MKKIIKSAGSALLILTLSVFGFVGSVTQSAQAATTYTAAQIATHNTASDCWVSIEGNVYNLTSFIPIHPGGSAAIIALCGTDATAALSSAPHGLSILPDVTQYIIGTLSTSTTPVLTSVTITSTASAVTVGGTSQLAATPKDQNGNLFVGATTTFSSSNTAVATVNSSTGLVTGVTAGTATITATSVSGATTVTSTTTITVTAIVSTPILTSVTITPTSPSISVSGTVLLTPSPKDQNGTAFVGATTTFSSSNTAVATVNSSTGLVTGVTAGTATITATSVSGNVTVTGTAIVTVTTTTVGRGSGDDGNEAIETENEIGDDNTTTTPPPVVRGGGEHEHEGGTTTTSGGTTNHHHANSDDSQQAIDD